MRRARRPGATSVEESRSKPITAGRATHDVVLDERAMDAIDAHVGATTDIEQGGVLVGDVDEVTGRVTVQAAVAATKAVGTAASLTFTHDTWDEVNNLVAEEYPDHRIVGWYHSHPSFGIFLSDYDTFIHANFFPASWQLAYVIDPLRGQAGFFGWEDGTIVRFATWTVLAHGGARSVKREATREPEGTPSPESTAFEIPRKLRLMFAGLLAVTLAVGLIAGSILFRSSPSPTQAFVAPPVIPTFTTVVIAPGLSVSRSWLETGLTIHVTVFITNNGGVGLLGSVQSCAPPRLRAAAGTVGPTLPTASVMQSIPCAFPTILGPGATELFVFQGDLPASGITKGYLPPTAPPTYQPPSGLPSQ